MMAARAWPLGKRSGWRENRHDHLRGRARTLTRPSPACRYLPEVIKLTLPTPWEGTYPGYHRIRLVAIHCPQAEKAADWEFTYYRQGVLTHVLYRNILANSTHAYALYWSTPQAEWGQSWHIFQTLARTFQPAS